MLGFIKNVSQRPMKLEEAKLAKEVFMVGSHTLVRGATPGIFTCQQALFMHWSELSCGLPFSQVMPVIKWDDTEILQTKPYAEVGVMALSLRALLEEDMDPTANKYARAVCGFTGDLWQCWVHS